MIFRETLNAALFLLTGYFIFMALVEPVLVFVFYNGIAAKSEDTYLAVEILASLVHHLSANNTMIQAHA